VSDAKGVPRLASAHRRRRRIHPVNEAGGASQPASRDVFTCLWLHARACLSGNYSTLGRNTLFCTRLSPLEPDLRGTTAALSPACSNITGIRHW
jgi:hypothetical protein